MDLRPSKSYSLKSQSVSSIVAATENTEVDLEHALRIVGIGIYNLKYCALFAGFLVSSIIETVGYSFVLPAAKCDLKMSDSIRGFVSSLPYIAIVLTSHFWGYMADTRGRKSTLVFSSLCTGILGASAAFMPNLISFALVKFIASLFLASPSSLCYAYIGEMLPSSARDITLSIVNSLQIIGSACVPQTTLFTVFAWAVLPAGFEANFGTYLFKPWRLLVIVNAAPFILCGLIMIFGPESPKYLVSKNREDEALEILKTMYAGNKRKKREEFPVSRLKTSHNKESEAGQKINFLKSLSLQTTPLFKPPYLKWLALNGFLLFGVFMVLNGLMMWVPDVLNRVMSGSTGDGVTACYVIKQGLNSTAAKATICDDSITTNTFIINSIANACCAVLSLLASLTVKVVGKKVLLVSIFWIIGIALILIGVVTQQIVFAIFLALLSLTGVAIGPINAFGVQKFPTELRAMAVGLALMFGRLGSIVGTNIAGVLINAACEATFYSFGGLLIICGLFSLLLPRSKV